MVLRRGPEGEFPLLQTLGTIEDTFRYLCPIDLYWDRNSVSARSDILLVSADTIRYRPIPSDTDTCKYRKTLGTIRIPSDTWCPIDLYWYRVSVSAISDTFRVSADTIRYRYFQVSDGNCEVSGDPHYYTFDKQVHHFMGTCTYTLSILCKDEENLTYFNVEAANENRGDNTGVSYVKSVNVYVYGYKITLEKNRVVKVDGQTVTLPIHLAPDVDVGICGWNVLVTTGFGLQVRFDGKQRVVITILGYYSGKVCGLCGNFNGNPADDFLNPDGVLEPDSNSLGNSWQVDNDPR
ncbi:unnamed protein product [Ranitomeya imitator]|uniref:VWFD domain-containing protein n=1 Tax=Ranitomeya imitator TaxID=111125 RepID=A0ABN9LFB8_9NEOB|nr:unnamed protein product [Ranitomeya imitator]